MSLFLKFRTARHLTQQQLADLLGVTQSAVALYETGKRQVPAEKVADYERRLGGAITRYEMRPDIFGPPPAECPCQDKAASA
jgi:DNA-binding transcriptional regulator YdaS (Cro superfamily)